MAGMLPLAETIYLFTIGSAVWVVDGFFVFSPSLNTFDQTWRDDVYSDTIFEVGSYLMILRALNRKYIG